MPDTVSTVDRTRGGKMVDSQMGYPTTCARCEQRIEAGERAWVTAIGALHFCVRCWEQITMPGAQRADSARRVAQEIASRVRRWIDHHIRMEQTRPEPLRLDVIEKDTGDAIACALLAFPPGCAHPWVSTHKPPTIIGGEMCPKCGAIRAAPPPVEQEA